MELVHVFLLIIGIVLALDIVATVLLFGKIQTCLAVTEIANESFKQAMLLKGEIVGVQHKIDESLRQANEANQRSGAIERWTQSIVAAPATPDIMKNAEEQIRKMTGMANEDFDSDLAKHGFNDTPDELV